MITLQNKQQTSIETNITLQNYQLSSHQTSINTAIQIPKKQTPKINLQSNTHNSNLYTANFN